MGEVKNAFVLAGGRGERLKPLTDSVPKVMVEVNGKPLLEYNIDLLKKYNIGEIVLGTGYLHEKIEEYFGNGEDFGVRIQYSKEDELLGTGGALKFAAGNFPEFFGERFLLINGDEMKDVDFREQNRVHENNKAMATLALKKVDDVSHFGVAEITGNRIVNFVEKPKPEEAPSNLVNAGAYILEPEIIKLIPEGKVSLEARVFPEVAKMGKLYGYEFKGQWFTTDDMQRLERAKREWKGTG